MWHFYLVTVCTFAMATEGADSNSAKANLNFLEADFVLAQYITVTTEEKSAA